MSVVINQPSKLLSNLEKDTSLRVLYSLKVDNETTGNPEDHDDSDHIDTVPIENDQVEENEDEENTGVIIVEP